MKKIILTLCLLVSVQAFAKNTVKRNKTKNTVPAAAAQRPIVETKTIDMGQQFNNLGNNEEIIKKAKALQPNNSMSIVQKREVDRNLRTELGLSYGYVAGADTYIDSRNWGANLDFHINPRWSLGLRYIDNKNALTSEGERVLEIARIKQQNGDTDYVAPAIDFPLRTYMAVINWYPVYGKVSWLESAVSQFDFYVIAGGGQTQLTNSNSPIFTAGLGMGMWVNSWFTSRLEVRYQNYKDHPQLSDERNINSFVMQLGIGIML